MTALQLIFANAISAGAGVYVGAHLRKKGENLATHEDIHLLVDQVKAVTVAAKEIEAKVDRASRVHERQLLILQRLYVRLFDIQQLFQRMIARVRPAEEKSSEEYAPLVHDAVVAAQEEFRSSASYSFGWLV